METGSCPVWSEDSVEVKSLSSGWLLYFSDLSSFTLISDSGFLLFRSIRICVTHIAHSYESGEADSGTGVPIRVGFHKNIAI